MFSCVVSQQVFIVGASVLLLSPVCIDSTAQACVEQVTRENALTAAFHIPQRTRNAVIQGQVENC